MNYWLMKTEPSTFGVDELIGEELRIHFAIGIDHVEDNRVGAAIGDNRQVDVEHESPGVEDLVPDLLFNSLRQFRDLIYGAMRARDGARPSGIARSSRCATASMARTPARSAVSA